jgi:NB-ARC domain-containing protein/TIR domain-containing protein/apoptotic protease-activating factor 1-like protein
MTSIFLSYARDDDEVFARRLYKDLVVRGFEVWFDRESMPSRQLTFHKEITDAIADHDRFLLVIGPTAVTSGYVIQEWRKALELDKCITPIIRLDKQGDDGNTISGYDLLPVEIRNVHAEDFRNDFHYEEHFNNLVRQLSEPLPLLGKLFDVPTLPQHYIPLREQLCQLKETLLRDLQGPVLAAAKLGVKGMAGIGKSILANALVREPDVRRTFPDGIFWISMGQQPYLLELQNRLLADLSDESVVDSLRSGKQRLRELLASRAVLLILDDVWRSVDVDVFDVLGPRCKLLLTTRDSGLITTMADNGYQVELPSDTECLMMLAAAARVSIASLPALATEIVSECDRLPLALALCGGMAAKGHRWERIRSDLREKRLELIADRHKIEEHHRSIWRAMQVSVQVLSPNEQRRFAELAVFTGNHAGIPEEAILTLWSHTGKLDELAASDLLVAFNERSLVQLNQYKHASGSVRIRMSLHDLLHDFASRIASDLFGSLNRLHQQLLNGYGEHCTDGWHSGPNDGYFLQKLAHHLIEARRTNELVALLFDFRWLSIKIDQSAGLDQDFGLILQAGLALGEKQKSHLMRLREVVGSLRSTETLPTLLWGHFAGRSDRLLRKLLKQAGKLTQHPWLRPITASLANDFIVRTITDADHVESLAIGDMADGEPMVAAVVGWSPRRLRIWIGGVRMTDIPVPNQPFLKEISEGGDHMVTAMNLPSDSRPALLHAWTDPVKGRCCRLLDLSSPTTEFAARLLVSWHQPELGLADPYVIGKVVILGDGEPESIGTIAGRLVLLAYFPARHPQLVGKDGRQITFADLKNVDESVLEEWDKSILVRFSDSEYGSDELERLERLAGALTSALGEQVTLEPKKSIPPQAVVSSIENGQVIPNAVWSLPQAARPLLVGDFEGEPFLVFKDANENAAIWKANSSAAIPLSWMSYAQRPVLSYSNNRPMIVKGAFEGVEVVDVSSGKSVGVFSKHLDNARLFAAGRGEDGIPLVASTGSLGSRGRFSTSVRIWNLKTQKQIAPTGTAHTGEIKAITHGSYRGNPVFATGGWDLICIWPTQVVPWYSSEQEPNQIADPNICGRIPLNRLPSDYRHHDLGAVRLLSLWFGGISTWAAPRSNTELLNSTQQEWSFGEPDRNDQRTGFVSSAVDTGEGSDVVSVLLSGESPYLVIETTRRDGTRREWKFSPRADWERQFSNWHYWHCVSVSGALLNGARVSIRVDPYYGGVTVSYDRGPIKGTIKSNLGTPATQCALGADGKSFVLFDERGTEHHFELVIP